MQTVSTQMGAEGSVTRPFVKALALAPQGGLWIGTEGTGLSRLALSESTPIEGGQAEFELGYLPQELGLYPNLTAVEFLDYMARLKGLTQSASRRQQVAEALTQVRLTEVAHRRLKTYSGGMKCRVGIAQALLGQPGLVIVDEPTVGLDPEERVRLRTLLSDLAGRCTVILSTHIIEDIGQSCHALAVMGQGQVLFQGSPRDLMAQVQGQVWLIESSGERPEGNLAIVSTVQLPHATQFRVVGTPPVYHHPAQLVEPTLEDAYLGLFLNFRPHEHE